jgi:hypothetical protein
MAANIDNLMSFDVSNFTFSALRKNMKGGKSVYINVNGTTGRKFFRLPECRAPFGLSSYTDNTSGNVSYTLNISLDDSTIVDKIREIEESVLKHVSSHSEEILGKKYNEDVIRQALFKSCVVESKDGKYAPTLKLKVMNNNGVFDVSAFTHNRAETTIDTLQKGQHVKTLVDFNQVWIIDNKFGISIRLKQVMLSPTSNLKECAFDDGLKSEHSECDGE